MISSSDRSTKVAIKVLALILIPFAIQAQNTNPPSEVLTFEGPELPVGVELPPGVKLPPGIKLPSKDSGSKTNTPASPEEKRLQELLKLQFDRRGPAVLEAMAKQAQRQGENTNQVEEFKSDVIAGNWKSVKEFLAKLPEKHAPQVYKHLLEALDKAPSSGGGPGPSEMPPQPGNRGQSPQPFLLPDDIIALSELLPGELSEEQVELLGKLLTKALSRGNFIEPFITRLETGTERLGGSDPKKRALALKLLLAANRLNDASKFLPELEPALKTNDVKSLDLHARYLTSLGKQKQETNSLESLRKAWDLTQQILAVTNAPTKEREQALSRSLELMPLLANDSGSNWLRQTFQQRPEQGLAILAAVANQVAQGLSNRETETRKKNLELQRRVVDQLLEVSGGNASAWQTALNVLALGWMQEADLAKNRPVQRQNRYQQFDPYGNPMFFDESGPGNFQDPNQLPAVPIAQLLPTAPSDSWLALLDKTLLPRVRILVAELQLKVDEDQKALPYLEAIAGEQPKAALNLANDLLRAWTRSRDPNPQMANRYGPYGPVWYGPGSPYGMSGSGTPLTRAMQVRNLAELTRLLDRLQKLPIPALDQKVVVGAFSGAHSKAEVFRTEDIEGVFGPLADIKPETMAEILQTMRERLAGQWRAQRVQQEAKTKRSDKEVEAEVTRGYELVLDLIQKGLQQSPEDWRMNLVHGAALFDWAEFDYGKKVDLAIYVEKRDRAFKSFEKAAALYAAKAPSFDEKEQTPQVFQQWFNASLGASDLSYITRQTEPNTNNLDKIHVALFGLPPEVVERHVTAFGKGLSDSINTLKPELKPRYLRAGIRVVGDHESAAEVRKLAMYYDDLLQEITFDVRVDGDATVGHGKPFGIFVALRHTEALGRESGGFGKYLQNQQNASGYYYNPYGKPPVNYREDFEKQVREKFNESFDILSITFHDDKVQARGYGRPKWRETPYAYLLLKAKDGAVDRIPALQLDLDFFDRRGQVILPVASQVQLIDARPENVPARPVKKVELLQIVDERDLRKGALTLEIKATAHGLLPELKELLDVSVPGFKVDKVDDKGLAISKMDTEAEEVAPVSERNWLINLVPDNSAGVPASFTFPKARLAGVELTYKRYADADLVEVKPELALAGLPLKPRSTWKWVGFGATLIVLGFLFAAWKSRQRRGVSGPSAAAYSLPAELTPFTVLNLLRRIDADQTITLPADQRRELNQTIAGLQEYFFARRPGSGNGKPDLEQLARRWVSSTASVSR